MELNEIREKVGHLVDKFSRLSVSGEIKKYNEAQTRNEFIEPLFELLGWDMRDLEKCQVPLLLDHLAKLNLA